MASGRSASAFQETAQRAPAFEFRAGSRRGAPGEGSALIPAKGRPFAPTKARPPGGLDAAGSSGPLKPGRASNGLGWLAKNSQKGAPQLLAIGKTRFADDFFDAVAAVLEH